MILHFYHLAHPSLLAIHKNKVVGSAHTESNKIVQCTPTRLFNVRSNASMPRGRGRGRGKSKGGIPKPMKKSIAVDPKRLEKRKLRKEGKLDYETSDEEQPVHDEYYADSDDNSFFYFHCFNNLLILTPRGYDGYQN